MPLTPVARGLADYTGPWPPPRYWGVTPEELRTVRTRRRVWSLAHVVVALAALPIFWLPKDLFTRHPALQVFVLNDFGRLFPVVRVVAALSPLGPVLAFVWMIVLTGSLVLLVPAYARYTGYQLACSDYSFIRWKVLASGTLTPGTGLRRLAVFLLIVFGLVMTALLIGDLDGYLAFAAGATPKAVGTVSPTLQSWGLLTGYGYRHSVWYTAADTRVARYAQLLWYGFFVMAFSSMVTLFYTVATHWQECWRNTRSDADALDVLWTQRQAARQAEKIRKRRAR